VAPPDGSPGSSFRPYRPYSELEPYAGPMAGLSAVVAAAGAWYLFGNLYVVLIAAAIVAAVVGFGMRYADEIAEAREQFSRARQARAATEWPHLTLRWGSGSTMTDVDRRLEEVQRRLVKLPGDLGGLAPVPFAVFRWRLAELLERRDAVGDALRELLASAATVEDADVTDTAAPLKEELAGLDAAYDEQMAALQAVEKTLARVEADKRLAEASAKARQVAGANSTAVAATELWRPVDALADALQGLSAGYRDLREDPTRLGPALDRTDPRDTH